MVDTTLTARYPLGGLDILIADTRLSSVENLDIVSVSLPHYLEHEKTEAARISLSEKLQTTFGLELTETGVRSSDDDNSHALIGLQPGLWFMMTTQRSREPARTLKTCLGDTAFLTDQSDSWAILDIDGPHAKAALERICPIDIDDSVFDDKCVIRTSMEHLSVILERPEPTRFRLYSPASSTQSFLHTVKVSLQNVV